jgi:hypothetical protein
METIEKKLQEQNDLLRAQNAALSRERKMGIGINEWSERFIRQLERAQLASCFCWSESVKMDVLENHLEGKPGKIEL